MADAPLLLDRYRILRKLGRGTFATVYLADDLKMGRQVAVKVVEHTADTEGRAVREAQAAAKLSHPHIVTVYEAFQDDDRTLLFTEYVEGDTLRELLVRDRLGDAELVEMAIQVCRALEHAHKRGVIHRDIKPENIMLVDAEGVDVRIMDFGVAHLEEMSSITIDGDLLGTLAYMAPEQLAGGPVDARVDVYALALTLYEGLTGANPLRGKSAAELLRASYPGPFPPLSRLRTELPTSLGDALTHGLEVDPKLRPDAAGFRKLLEKAAKEMPEPVEGEHVEGEIVDRLREWVLSERVVYAARHVAAGGLALAVTAYLLPRVPFYPQATVFPLVAACAFATLLSPFLGALAVSAVLAPPVFTYSVGWGLLVYPAALVFLVLLRWRGHEWAALLPAAMPVLVLGKVGLAVPVLAAVTLGAWGPVVAGASALALAVTAGFTGWPELPYTFTEGVGPVLRATKHETLPGDVATALARFLDQRPELLLQLGLFALFGLPIARLLRGSAERRLWVGCAYLGAFLVAFAVSPPLVVGVSVDVGELLVAYVPCVIIGLLFALLASPEEPRHPLE